MLDIKFNIKTFQKVNEIVMNGVITGWTGTKFYDYLDHEIRNNIDILHSFYEVIQTLDDSWLVVLSGRFGKNLINYLRWIDYTPKTEVLLFEGGLRHNDIVDNVYKYLKSYKGCKAIFMDDTMYQGRTMGKISDMLRIHSIKIKEAVVVFDAGLVNKQDKWGTIINSLYRRIRKT